jgi:hypothetical protein
MMGQMKVAKSFTLSGGSFKAPRSLSLSGNMDVQKGIFDAGMGTVFLDGDDQAIRGGVSFFNLSKTGGRGGTLKVGGAAPRITIRGTLTLQGSQKSVLTVRSEDATKQWTLDVQGRVDISNAIIQQCRNANEKKPVSCGTRCKDGGNNVGWLFKK